MGERFGAVSQGVRDSARVYNEATAGVAPGRTRFFRLCRRILFGLFCVFAGIGLVELGLDRQWLVLTALLVMLIFVLNPPIALPAVPLALLKISLAKVLLLGTLALPLIGLVRVVMLPLVALLGFNTAWHWLDLSPMDLVLGLIVAVGICGLGLYVCLRLATPLRLALPGAVALAAFLVLGVPAGVGKIHEWTADDVPEGKPVVVYKLDLLFITPRAAEKADLPPIPDPPKDDAWDVNYSVAREGTHGIRWLLLDSKSQVAATKALQGRGPALDGEPTLREDENTDHLLLLAVDGTKPVVRDVSDLQASVPASRAEVKRWKAIVERSRLPPMPTFALLESGNRNRVFQWRRGFEPTGGGAVALQGLEIPVLTDVGRRLAVRSPEADAESSLAVHFRPIIRFDRTEKQARPLNVNDVLESGAMTLCPDELTSDGCQEMNSAEEVTNGSNHLALSQEKLAAATRLRSNIYFHAVPRTEGDRDLLYLDYWWYLPFNPTPFGGGALCGAGLTIRDVTCFDHESDWEGVTVVLERRNEKFHPVAVHYAQHKDVISYDWRALRAAWRARKLYRDKYSGNVDDAKKRPFVFPAADSHASYATPDGVHRQVAEITPDGPRHGQNSWSENPTAECLNAAEREGHRKAAWNPICVRPLPTLRSGKAASWNAYTGLWGSRHCKWSYYCDRGDGPHSPADQPRYKAPWECSGEWVPGQTRKISDDCS